MLSVSPNPMIWGDDAFQYGQVYPVAMPGAGAIGGFPFAMKAPAATMAEGCLPMASPMPFTSL